MNWTAAATTPFLAPLFPEHTSFLASDTRYGPVPHMIESPIDAIPNTHHGNPLDFYEFGNQPLVRAPLAVPHQETSNPVVAAPLTEFPTEVAQTLALDDVDPFSMDQAQFDPVSSALLGGAVMAGGAKRAVRVLFDMLATLPRATVVMLQQLLAFLVFGPMLEYQVSQLTPYAFDAVQWLFNDIRVAYVAASALGMGFFLNGVRGGVISTLMPESMRESLSEKPDYEAEGWSMPAKYLHLQFNWGWINTSKEIKKDFPIHGAKIVWAGDVAAVAFYLPIIAAAKGFGLNPVVFGSGLLLGAITSATTKDISIHVKDPGDANIGRQGVYLTQYSAGTLSGFKRLGESASVLPAWASWGIQAATMGAVYLLSRRVLKPEQKNSV